MSKIVEILKIQSLQIDLLVELIKQNNIGETFIKIADNQKKIADIVFWQELAEAHGDMHPR